jgi:hypothetical protein
MEKLPHYGPIVSLIPGGILQFLDLRFNIEQVAKLRRYFWEYTVRDTTASTIEQDTFLVCLDVDEATQEYIDRSTGEVAIDPRTKDQPPGRQRKISPEYNFNAEKGIEIFLGEWVPLPMLRKERERPDGRPQFARGPSNWARARIVPLAERDRDGNTHHLTIAFDTRVEPASGGAVEPALTERDVNDGADFLLASDERDCGWFVNLDWVADWVDDLLATHRLRQRKGRPPSDADGQYACEHIARYLSFLQILDQLDVVPQVRLVSPAKYAPVEVDLVLDVGNSRTCGILIETAADKQTDLNDSYVLELRDLSMPDRRYREPFSSSLEFALSEFGDPHKFARGSGRLHDAFTWPSVVRVGPEAARLAVHSKGARGSTGMSSPKRYLWDQYERTQEWRFNTTRDDAFATEEPVVRGPLVEFVNNAGTPTDRVDDVRVRRDPAFRGQTGDPVTTPVFSRSSLMMFLLSEIVCHALVTINSPAQRTERRNSDIPRRLRRIILTMPTAMPIAERKIFTRWAEWAVETTWRAFGWEDLILQGGNAQDARGRDAPSSARDYRLSPEVRCDWDEASATQIVYLYNEIVQKLRGDVDYFFDAMGRKRGGERPSLRIATIDIGGGTTDVIISTYQSLGSGAAAVIQPSEDFREGFNIAGDNILRAVVENHVVHQIRAAMGAAGAQNPRDVLTRLIGGDFGGQSEQERALRNRFIRQVATPIGLAILERYEPVDLKQGNQLDTMSLRDFFTPENYPQADVLDFVDQAARSAGAVNFAVEDVRLTLDMAEIDDTVRREIGGILADLCEVIHMYDCDVLLLSGRPSCLPAVRSAVLAKIPLAPHRVVPLHEYHLGSWYPFRSTSSRLIDPKTMASVGAMLCALAEGHLDSFSFQTSRLKPRSTARFVGELELSGQIRHDKVLFPPLDLDSKDEIELERTIDFHAPIFIGFRQLEAERWTATPFYRLAFSNNTAVNNARGRLPYKVNLAFTRKAAEEEDGMRGARIGDMRDEGAFRITEITAADGGPARLDELDLRLQTLREETGYWLDTGILTIA